MEYRIHSRNNLQLSVLGFNLCNIITVNDQSKFLDLNEILKELKSRKINFISVPYLNNHLIKDLLEWEKENKFYFIKSFQFGYLKNEPYTFLSPLNRGKIIENRFQTLEDQIKTIFNSVGIKKIDFLTLMYPKLTHFDQNNMNFLLEKVKSSYPITSFGVQCQYLSDALLICKHYNIDHVVIEIDIGSSSDLINAIFKIAKSKNISVLCSLNKIFNDFENKSTNNLNSLSELLINGTKVLTEKILSGFSIPEREIYQLIIAKYIESNFQSIIISVNNFELIKNAINCLSKPYLTYEEQDLLKKSLQPPFYDSPKNKHLK